MNSEVFTETVTVSWLQMAEEYQYSKRVTGVTAASLYETALTLRNFERLIGTCSSKQITQNIIDQFILKRGNEVKRPTVNKDIRNLKTFINWCRKNRYVNGEIEIKQLKENERPVKSLNSIQVKKLFLAVETYQTMKIRILLALSTGLRRGDIESLKISDIDFANSYITTTSRKTRKSMGSRPVPSEMMAELVKYVSELDVSQQKYSERISQELKWKKSSSD